MKAHTGIHRFLLVMIGTIWLFESVICVVLTLAFILPDQNLNLLWFPAALIAVGSFLAWCVLYEYAEVMLTDDGVFVRVIWRKRFYRWDEIKQAGILFLPGRGVPYERIYLVKPNGTKRHYRDKTFLLRNIGKLIHLPAGKEYLDFVKAHYGALDFNLAYGRTEQSEVGD